MLDLMPQDCSAHTALELHAGDDKQDGRLEASSQARSTQACNENIERLVCRPAAVALKSGLALSILTCSLSSVLAALAVLQKWQRSQAVLRFYPYALSPLECLQASVQPAPGPPNVQPAKALQPPSGAASTAAIPPGLMQRLLSPQSPTQPGPVCNTAAPLPPPCHPQLQHDRWDPQPPSPNCLASATQQHQHQFQPAQPDSCCLGRGVC